MLSVAEPPANPTAAQRSNERLRCARTGEPVPEWAKLRKDGPGRPKAERKPPTAPPKGRGNRPRAHVKAKRYNASNLLEAPPCLQDQAKQIYEAQAKSMLERGVLTIETQPTLVQLAYLLEAQWEAMASSYGPIEDAERVAAQRLAKSYVADIARLSRDLEMRAEDARKGLHSGADKGPKEDDLIG